MQGGIFSSHTLFSTALAFALAACASQPSTTTVTAASVAPAPKSAESPPPLAEAAPPGELVCRAETRDDGTSALYLEWKGDSAKGVLRHISPSGMVSDTNVHAQRFKGMVIADDPSSQDLVVHAATVAQHNGKPYLRLGETKSSWMRCQ
jgi:hypothetical protein